MTKETVVRVQYCEKVID